MKKFFGQVKRIVLVPLLMGLVYAVAIKYFIRPSLVIMTGTEGLSLATSYFLDSETVFVVLYLLFQAVLLVFAFIRVNVLFSLKTLVTVAGVALFILVLPMIKVASPEPENERLVLVLFGAILSGIAKAFSLKNRGSVGDEDIIAVYFSEKLRKPVGKILVYAGIVSMIYGLILSYLKSGNISSVANTLIYTSIFIFVSAETVNTIFKRFNYSRLTVNIEDESTISRILKEHLPDRSYTVIDVHGSYLKNLRKEITIILSQEELPVIVEAIKKSNINCFLYHNRVDGIEGRFNLLKF